jgi:hypothetical protein
MANRADAVPREKPVSDSQVSPVCRRLNPVHPAYDDESWQSHIRPNNEDDRKNFAHCQHLAFVYFWGLQIV